MQQWRAFLACAISGLAIAYGAAGRAGGWLAHVAANGGRAAGTRVAKCLGESVKGCRP
jgi:hypothetical protein